jgi:hypothetical protein
LKINPHTELLRELVSIQTARRANWPTAASPADAALETQHAAQLSHIQEQLSAHRVTGPEKTPADYAANNSYRCGGSGSAGNIFSRIIRRILINIQ